MCWGTCLNSNPILNVSSYKGLWELCCLGITEIPSLFTVNLLFMKVSIPGGGSAWLDFHQKMSDGVWCKKESKAVSSPVTQLICSRDLGQATETWEYRRKAVSKWRWRSIGIKPQMKLLTKLLTAGTRWHCSTDHAKMTHFLTSYVIFKWEAQTRRNKGI